MFKSRQLVFSTLVFALLPPFMLRGASSAIEYVGGTVKDIPANATGTFNFDDAKELRFNYGQSVYAVPYEQITAADTAKGETHHILRKIPVPSFSHDPKETLTIAYKDAAGATGTLSFDLTPIKLLRSATTSPRRKVKFRPTPKRDRMNGGATSTGRRVATRSNGTLKARRTRSRPRPLLQSNTGTVFPLTSVFGGTGNHSCRYFCISLFI